MNPVKYINESSADQSVDKLCKLISHSLWSEVHLILVAKVFEITKYLNALGKYLVVNTNTFSSQTTDTITQNLLK